jgi:hypothetical protein
MSALVYTTNIDVTIATTDTTNTILKANIISYIKWVMLELACNNKIDHRNYDRDNKAKSRLYDTIKSNDYDFNYGISLVADTLLSDNNTLQKIIFRIEEISKSDEELKEDDGDERYELEDELFHYVNDFIGLHEIGSLHGDDADIFKDKLYGLLIGLSISTNINPESVELENLELEDEEN